MRSEGDAKYHDDTRVGRHLFPSSGLRLFLLMLWRASKKMPRIQTSWMATNTAREMSWISLNWAVPVGVGHRQRIE
jgi:hypothetical protein